MAPGSIQSQVTARGSARQRWLRALEGGIQQCGRAVHFKVESLMIYTRNSLEIAGVHQELPNARDWYDFT